MWNRKHAAVIALVALGTWACSPEDYPTGARFEPPPEEIELPDGELFFYIPPAGVTVTSVSVPGEFNEWNPSAPAAQIQGLLSDFFPWIRVGLKVGDSWADTTAKVTGVGADSVTDPAALWLYDREAKSLTKLFTSRPELEGAPLVDMRHLTATTRRTAEEFRRVLLEGLPAAAASAAAASAAPPGAGGPACRSAAGRRSRGAQNMSTAS